MCNETIGTPLVSSMFELARQQYRQPAAGLRQCRYPAHAGFSGCGAAGWPARRQHFLMVGQRWDLDVPEELDFSPAGLGRPPAPAHARNGSLHPRGGSDYFIFPRECFANMPDFAIGRAGWDNWMIYAARQQGLAGGGCDRRRSISSTRTTITAICPAGSRITACRKPVKTSAWRAANGTFST